MCTATHSDRSVGVLLTARQLHRERDRGELLIRGRGRYGFPALVTDSPIRDADGRPIDRVGGSSELSERAEVMRSMEQSEQRFRSMFEHHPDAVFAFHRTGRVILANPACERLSGYTVEEILAEPRAYAPSGEHERGAALFQAALQGEPQRFESIIVHKSGHYVDVWTTQIPIVVDGEITGVFGITRQGLRP